MHEYGMLALVPPLIVVVSALWMRRSFEPLLLGCLSGYAMIAWHGANGSVSEMFKNFPNNFVDGLMKVMEDPANVWVILVCGLLGSILYLLINSGSIYAFGNWVLRYVQSRKSALVMSWLLGLFIFIDDYMSALTVGNTMRNISDRFRISREMLAFMINSMAAPLCLIVPLTTWTVYVGGLLKTSGWATSSKGLPEYWIMIPYMFYAWVIVIISLMVAMGWLPLWGKMKTAEARVQDGGEPSPPGSPKHAIEPIGQNTTYLHFLLPILVLVGATIFFDNDALKGAMATIFFTIAYYYFSKVHPYDHMGEGIWLGFNTMVFALAILMVSYVLKDVNSQMGLTPYVIDSVKPYVSPQMLPVIIFLSMGLIATLTASNWGLYAVAIPIIIPLAQATGSHTWLCLAALVSAGGLGSQACFYSDTSVLTTTSAEVHPIEMMWTQLPYVGLATIISSVLFIIAGYTV
jgi:Na+/H+ antiporter NhaC